MGAGNTPKTVTNTTARENHREWLFGGNPEAIEAQEARGQEELVASDVIPTDLRGATEDDLQGLGFELGPAVEGDPLFRFARLPNGWTKVGSSHAMWSYIYDAEGHPRFACFYKAAFYDRAAFMRCEEA